MDPIELFLQLEFSKATHLGLFSLVLMEVLDNIGNIPDLKAQLWYLNDGIFIGSMDVSSLLNSLVEKGPEFGIYVNMSKC